MRAWKVFELDPVTGRTGAVADSLAAWLRETLRAIPAGPVEVETNLGGLDEAGTPSPDLDWVGVVADAFPALGLQVTYRIPATRQEAVAPYEVRLRWGDTVRRAWVEITGPGRWAVMQD